MDEGAGSLVKRRCLSQLVSDPLIGWMPGHPDVNNVPRPELNEKEGKQGTKPEIGDLKDVARLDLMGVVVEEGGPALAMVLR